MKPVTRIWGYGFLLLSIGLLPVGSTWAADSRHDGAAMDAASIEDRFLERIQMHEGLNDQVRERMRENLHACIAEGATLEELEPLFPGEESAGLGPQAMLRMQERMRQLLQEGVDPHPMVEKVREGITKRAPADRIEFAATRMADHLQAAHRFLDHHFEDMTDRGHARPGEQGDVPKNMMERHLALDFWSGLDPDDLEGMHDRVRARDGGCGAADFVAAVDVAAMLHDRGMAREHALDMAEQALHSGYGRHELHRMGWALTRADIDDHGDEIYQHMMEGMGAHHDLDQMVEDMMGHGWMGPADMGSMGSWGSMMDDWMGGGPGDHHDDGHMGGDGGGGGMGGGGMGGGGH